MIQLNYRDSKPIYEQIKESLRRLIVTGIISEDEQLPSVREMASSLAINPNTIQRAYRELENEGYIYKIVGKGTFSAPQQEIVYGRKVELLKIFDETVSELLYLSEDGEELKKRITKLEKGEAAQ